MQLDDIYDQTMYVCASPFSSIIVFFSLGQLETVVQSFLHILPVVGSLLSMHSLISAQVYPPVLHTYVHMQFIMMGQYE